MNNDSKNPADGANDPATQDQKLPPCKLKVLSSNFKDDMFEAAVAVSRKALAECKIEKDVATTVKKAFDEKFEQTWQCIVGKRFGCSVTHDTSYLLFMQIDQTFVLLFKSHE